MAAADGRHLILDLCYLCYTGVILVLQDGEKYGPPLEWTLLTVEEERLEEPLEASFVISAIIYI